MKKLFCLFILLINTLTFSENIYEEMYQLATEKEATKMYTYYYCPVENIKILKKCNHENVVEHIFYNDYIFEKEFEANEQRAINMLKQKNSLFFICGKVKELSSGMFHLSYIIELENGVTIYLGEQFLNKDNPLEFTLSEDQKEKYLNLDKGDYVCVIAKEFLMNIHTGKTFMGAGIVHEDIIPSIVKDIKTVKEYINK